MYAQRVYACSPTSASVWRRLQSVVLSEFLARILTVDSFVGRIEETNESLNDERPALQARLRQPDGEFTWVDDSVERLVDAVEDSPR
jgi:hypothetical protein